MIAPYQPYGFTFSKGKQVLAIRFFFLLDTLCAHPINPIVAQYGHFFVFFFFRPPPGTFPPQNLPHLAEERRPSGTVFWGSHTGIEKRNFLQKWHLKNGLCLNFNPEIPVSLAFFPLREAQHLLRGLIGSHLPHQSSVKFRDFFSRNFLLFVCACVFLVCVCVYLSCLFPGACVRACVRVCVRQGSCDIFWSWPLCCLSIRGDPWQGP